MCVGVYLTLGERNMAEILLRHIQCLLVVGEYVKDLSIFY